MRKTSNEYIDYLKVKKNISKNTEASYRKDLDKLIEFLNLYRIFDYELINATNLNSYVLHMEIKGMSTATIMRNIAVMKGYFDYLFRTHRIPECITEDIKRPVYQSAPRQAVKTSDWEKILHRLNSGEVKNLRDLAMMEMMFRSKISVSELISMNLNDLNLDLGFVQCDSRGKRKMYSLSTEVVSVLKDYLENGRSKIVGDDEEMILFPNMQGNSMSRQGVWKMVKTHAKACGVEDVNLSRLCKGDGN